MKKSKILAIILIALIILGTFNITRIMGAYEGRWNNDKRYKMPVGKTNIWVEDFSQRYNNVYCVEAGQSFHGTNTFSWGKKVTIEGDVATFGEGKNATTVVNPANNILAAILTEKDLGRGTSVKGWITGTWESLNTALLGNKYLYGHYISDYYNRFYTTDAQAGVYAYLNTWIDAVGADKHGFSKFQNPKTDVGNEAVSEAKTLASKYNCKVTLYYLTNENGSQNQNLIAVYPEEPAEKSINIPVSKEWYDNNNTYSTRPSSITVKLLANGSETDKELVLNSGNQWQGKFTGLQDKDTSGKAIAYTVKEVTPDGYTSSITGTQSSGFKITNTLLTEIKVVKEWYDKDNLDEYRPDSITVELFANGNSTGKIETISQSDNWTKTFGKLNKYDAKGNEINYTVKEKEIAKYNEPVCVKTEDSKGNITITVKNTHDPEYEGYIEIKGKVWVDGAGGKGNDINGTLDDKDSMLEGIKVRLKYIDENGNHQLFNPSLSNVYETVTNANGEYIIVVNYDNSQNVYKLYEDSAIIAEKLKTAYVEFEYDGLKYTTVASADSGENTSKAVENETRRAIVDSNYSTVTSATNPNNWDQNNITATTKTVNLYDKYSETRDKVVKYCNGNGTYDRTDPESAWITIKGQQHSCANCNGTGHSMRTYGIEVGIIPNINLGLFEREQPDVAIFSDLTKVQVTMNDQKYTYLYGVRSNDKNNVGLQVKFQNKDTYTYRRPVNPADIAYIQEEANKDAMSVLVTYEVKVANLSTTLPITVHNITNYFDSKYTLNTSGWAVTPGTGFNQATSGELNITVEPQTESSAIELEYTVSVEAIRNLLNEEATLNNAVEIASYSTIYGADTLYAEQRSGERTNKPYGGYDYNSHPGNAGIFINNEGRLEAAVPEDDTDISPSFVLCKGDSKTLAGTIWEDTDENAEDEERLGNGHYEDTEKKVENVKVELYNIDGTQGILYYEEEGTTKTKPAVTYTESDGSYKLEGVVTGEYYMKFTYGDDTTKLEHEATTMDGGTTTINARNHKSTVITEATIKDLLSKDYESFSEEEKKWHITHEDGYSVAVDNMQERLEIGKDDLQYSNFDTPLNITALTKPFKTQVEFDADGQSKSDVEGKLEDATNILEKLDFGIAERPREDIFAQKTITNLKITLANGQILTEGNPTVADSNMNYVKAMGFRQEINSGEAARNAIEKQLLVEMDAELIQGAQLEVQYAVKIVNNNELDYDYGVYEDYKQSFEDEAKREYDKYITQNSKASYYYYGDSTGLSEMQATIQFVDYINQDLVYKEDATKWVIINSNDLETNGLIAPEVKQAITDRYKVLQNAPDANSNIKITLSRKEAFEQEMLASKVLANKDENVYDNSIEILSIDGKTGRTIQESTEGKQIKKSYEPGNYVPSLDSDTLEQDDDRVKIIITPPTGIVQYIIYVITALVGLIAIVAGVMFIKKKVLTK